MLVINVFWVFSGIRNESYPMTIIRVMSMVWLGLLVISGVAAQSDEIVPEYRQILRIERSHISLSPYWSEKFSFSCAFTVVIINSREQGNNIFFIKHGCY